MVKIILHQIKFNTRESSVCVFKASNVPEKFPLEVLSPCLIKQREYVCAHPQKGPTHYSKF